MENTVKTAILAVANPVTEQTTTKHNVIILTDCVLTAVKVDIRDQCVKNNVIQENMVKTVILRVTNSVEVLM
jgi:hypothetical protein